MSKLYGAKQKSVLLKNQLQDPQQNLHQPLGSHHLLPMYHHQMGNLQICPTSTITEDGKDADGYYNYYNNNTYNNTYEDYVAAQQQQQQQHDDLQQQYCYDSSQAYCYASCESYHFQ